VIIKRYLAWCAEHGEEADARVVRDGQELTFEEAAALAGGGIDG
jgi:hypothetical protein